MHGIGEFRLHFFQDIMQLFFRQLAGKKEDVFAHVND